MYSCMKMMGGYPRVDEVDEDEMAGESAYFMGKPIYKWWIFHCPGEHIQEGNLMSYDPLLMYVDAWICQCDYANCYACMYLFLFIYLLLLSLASTVYNLLCVCPFGYRNKCPYHACTLIDVYIHVYMRMTRISMYYICTYTHAHAHRVLVIAWLTELFGQNVYASDWPRHWPLTSNLLGQPSLATIQHHVQPSTIINQHPVRSSNHEASFMNHHSHPPGDATMKH